MTKTAISFAAASRFSSCTHIMAPCVCISVLLRTHAQCAGCGKNSWNNNSSPTSHAHSGPFRYFNSPSTAK